MARNNDLDPAAVLRLKHDIARDRLQLAQKPDMEQGGYESLKDPHTKVGRPYESSD